MERKTCETCKWWRIGAYGSTKLGWCRHYQHVLAVVGKASRITSFSDTCPEHTPRQERKEGENG